MNAAAVHLTNPKFAHNVGGALRACACFGADWLSWDGERVPAPEKWPPGSRLPREERIKAYRSVTLRYGSWLPYLIERGAMPVAVEARL